VCDLLRAELHSGRTHQIRVHLAHVGHPVVGDPVYGAGGPRRMTGPGRVEAERLARATPRQALHAAELLFKHPITGKRLAFRSGARRPPPGASEAQAGGASCSVQDYILSSSSAEP
jgi:23S rRNA-/tRNA-specific pseudouridylate synthase